MQINYGVITSHNVYISRIGSHYGTFSWIPRLLIALRSIIVYLRGLISRGLSTVSENSASSLLVSYLNILKGFLDNPSQLRLLYPHEYIRHLHVSMVG